MKTLAKWHSAGIVLALALLAALPVAGGAPDLATLHGGGIISAIACVVCAGGGVAALLSGGSLAWVIWTTSGTTLVMACAASCIAAVT